MIHLLLWKIVVIVYRIGYFSKQNLCKNPLALFYISLNCILIPVGYDVTK